jgi:hypothetical protein
MPTSTAETRLTAYKEAEQAFKADHIKLGLHILINAARKKDLRAQLRLGHLYREGKLVPADHEKACNFFAQAAGEHANFDSKHSAAPVVGEAYLFLAECFEKGVKGSRTWKRDVRRAADAYYVGGVIFNHSQALYKLSMAYLHGKGIVQNIRFAVSYLRSATKKDYPPAQAQLGFMMWQGKLVKRKAGRGLALLTIAKERAAPADAAWIAKLYQIAMKAATDNDLEEMKHALKEYRKVLAKPNRSNATQHIAFPERRNLPNSLPGEMDVYQSVPTVSPPTDDPEKLDTE